MALSAKAPPSAKSELPFVATPPNYVPPRRSRLSSALIIALKLSLPSIYLVSLLYRNSPPVVPTLFHAGQNSGLQYPSSSPLSPDYDDPASEFKDDIFPLRPQDPWDISTDFPHPRTLAYDVEEGTWLRLDVHPISGDVVFDMVGDIYCLPASAYSEASLMSGIKTQAVPVLTGVPHDSDPSFSPEGDRLAFKSDAGLGVDNIWVMPWAAGGCSAMDVRSPSIMTAETVALKDHDADLLAQGIKETEARKLRRLSFEGRLAGLCLRLNTAGGLLTLR
jgi:hypothetical protein